MDSRKEGEKKRKIDDERIEEGGEIRLGLRVEIILSLDEFEWGVLIRRENGLLSIGSTPTEYQNRVEAG